MSTTLVVVAGFAYRGYQGYAKRKAMSAPILPEFSEVPQGPRAPTTEGLGARVGYTMFAQLKPGTDTCKDTSARALMKRMRAAKKKKAQEAKAKGEPVDAVSSASSGKKSPMERNPQIRYSCENTEAHQIGDRDRTSAKGRLLYIFDSADHPLRLVSYRRLHRKHTSALKDAKTSVQAMIDRYGQPHSTTNALPSEAKLVAGMPIFPKYKPFKFIWSWADLRVTVSVMSYGRRGIDVLESVEVPWPVRSDAPQRPQISGQVAKAK